MPSLSEAASKIPSATIPSGAHSYRREPAAHEASLTNTIPQFRSTPIPWWLWWNILSFDAPVVACVWALLLLRSNGRAAPAAEILALAVTVWVIYTADRLLDGFATGGTSLLQARHSFAAKHRFVFGSLIFVAGTALARLSAQLLEGATVRAGLTLGAIVVLYLVTIHAGPARLSSLLPKEIAVGMIFAAGTSVPLWLRPVGFSFRSLAVSAMFGVLCSLNCLSIECWERARHDRARHQPPTLWIAWANSHLTHIALTLMIAAFISTCLSTRRDPVALPLLAISLGAFLILLLNQQRKSLSPEALRVFADAALVLPALLALALLHA
jgi:hypothetical protein